MSYRQKKSTPIAPSAVAERIHSLMDELGKL
jgi:hypothetical protein